MNKYDVQHVEKMLIPLSDQINELENKMNNADIYAVQELIKNAPGTLELSNQIKKNEHDINNLKMSVMNSSSIVKIIMERLQSLEDTNSQILKRIREIKYPK